MNDHSEALKLAERMKRAVKRLHELAPALGSAKQVKEFNSEMRRSALSSEVVRALKAGESATAAEHIARASESYQQKLGVLARQYEAAEATIAEYQAEQAAFDASRSLMSFNRETLRQLEG